MTATPDQSNDHLPMHPTVIEVGDNAFGLWARARYWSAANNTDGLVPYRVAYQLGRRKTCMRLVKAGLFEEKFDGYQIRVPAPMTGQQMREVAWLDSLYRQDTSKPPPRSCIDHPRGSANCRSCQAYRENYEAWKASYD
jgi:hypothetical protein